jgi:hypothetical protein
LNLTPPQARPISGELPPGHDDSRRAGAALGTAFLHELLEKTPRFGIGGNPFHGLYVSIVTLEKRY